MVLKLFGIVTRGHVAIDHIYPYPIPLLLCEIKERKIVECSISNTLYMKKIIV